MLTGRESLKRLIGKRRRFLPNRHSILSSPLGEKSLNLSKKEENDDFRVFGDSVELNTKNGGSEWVNCPVCGGKVRGSDEVINSHLDACLARGTKRKLSQRTLFQLNFCTQSIVKIHSVESDCEEITDTIESETDNNDICSTINVLSDSDGYEEDDNINNCKLDSVALKSKRFAVSAENQVSDDEINHQVDSASLAFEGKMSEHDMEASMDDDDLSNMSLETFIVGRRFADVTELNLGAKIFLLRDPDNAKDPNAIKVLPADSGCGKVLGFLPWELAQLLSPLIDKFQLCFEGCITFIPKHSVAVIPIKIVCQDKLLQSEKDSEDFRVLKSLWRNAVHAVESAKTCSPNITKYQRNLVLLIQEVLRCHSHIFTDGEKTLLETLTSLSHDSQRLFARLYTRKGPWFRMSNISYPEIFDCKGAIKELIAAGFICSLEAMSEIQEDDLKEVLNTLNIGELREMASTVNNENFPWPTGKRLKKCCHGTKKQDLIGLLVSSYKNAVCSNLQSLVLLKTSTCIRITISAESLIWRAERLFFLNGEQDLSSFLLVDLGIVKFPTYNCIQSEQIFKTRNDLLCYEEAIEVAQIMDESLDENNSDLVIRCTEVSDFRISKFSEAGQSSSSGSATALLSCFSASWVYSKVVLLGVSFLERKQSYADAINLLKRLLIKFTSDRRRGYWTLRLSVDLEHLGHINESLHVAEDGLLDPCVRAGSRMALQRRVLRLGKPPRRWKAPSYSNSVKRKIPEVHVQGIPLNSKMGMKSVFCNEDGEQYGVEQHALQYYAGEGGEWQGVHTESGIWLTIFGLLMWDIIFADVPNSFCTKFQTAPLDLKTDSFYAVRKSLIEELLKKIEGGMAEEILITSWQSHVGTACMGVNWDRHSLSELRAAVTCIGGLPLASILRHLAQDYRSWSSGMPDLLLWRFHDDYRGEAKLVEVKGPRDRLSEQQRAWLLFLMDCGFNAEVCKVSPALVSK